MLYPYISKLSRLAISPIITPSVFFVPLPRYAVRGFLHHASANVTWLFLGSGTKGVPEVLPLRLNLPSARSRTRTFVLTLDELVEVFCDSFCSGLDTLSGGCCCVSCLRRKIGRCNLWLSLAIPTIPIVWANLHSSPPAEYKTHLQPSLASLLQH